jgi:hypothetical protein
LTNRKTLGPLLRPNLPLGIVCIISFLRIRLYLRLGEHEGGASTALSCSPAMTGVGAAYQEGRLGFGYDRSGYWRISLRH